MSQWSHRAARLVTALAITALALAAAPAAASADSPDPIFEDPFGFGAASAVFADPLGSAAG